MKTRNKDLNKKKQITSITLREWIVLNFGNDK